MQLSYLTPSPSRPSAGKKTSIRPIRVLALTGRRAEGEVRASVARSRLPADVLVLDTDIAAFITPEMLQAANPRGYDLILLPGAITADFSQIEKELSTTIRLGPKHAVDLGAVLDLVDRVELSRTVPACALLSGARSELAIRRMEELEAMSTPLMTLKGVKIGGGSRMKVLSEIVDASAMSGGDLRRRISYYEEQGADMIDLGIPLNASASSVALTVRTARRATTLPISLDSTVPALIEAGVREGCDMVLSLHGSNLSAATALADAGVPAVVIPGPGSVTLQENLRKAISFGVDVVADPVLDPPMQGLASSLTRYLDTARDFPQVPLFFGAGNATELIDSDSTGANAILAALAAEVGAAILFTPEYSAKCRGSVRELRAASWMMMLAKDRSSPPKDLGIDLLLVREKRRRPEISQHPGAEEARPSARKFVPDPAGAVRIGLDGKQIVAVHDSITLAGRSARDILDALIDRGLVTRLDHAAYLGRELQRAELALELGRSYAQDDIF
ncbi:MAG: Pterin binding enzyme [Methanosaeta sp. PtaB.Bin039]|nr:MAG: Pterin binding enzyme [Methanosaeta sp. PtaB.Bin039]